MGDFDNAAHLYDDQFTHTSVGKAQREQVWRTVKKLMPSTSSKVLEINCGTGEDAKRWSQLGHSISATDISEGMIKRAREKFPNLAFSTLDARTIGEVPESYATIFSNFGGLNCLSPTELRAFFSNIQNTLEPHGKLILVIMGKKCLWDRLFMILKRKWKQRNRRNTQGFISVHVDGTLVKTWYYSPKEIAGFAEGHYTVTRKKPIGLFVPPSYLSAFFERKKFLFSFFRFMDKCLSFPMFSNYADHYLICLEPNHQQETHT